VRSASPAALLLVDAEGGRMDRLRALTDRRRRPRGSEAAARCRAGRWVAAVRSAGLDVDLAPVVDLDHGATDNARWSVLRQRPARIATRGAAFLRACERPAFSAA
jgi:beta-glucosidase-like glycosyl hydrolase